MCFPTVFAIIVKGTDSFSCSVKTSGRTLVSSLSLCSTSNLFCSILKIKLDSHNFAEAPLLPHSLTPLVPVLDCCQGVLTELFLLVLSLHGSSPHCTCNIDLMMLTLSSKSSQGFSSQMIPVPMVALEASPTAHPTLSSYIGSPPPSAFQA